MPLPVQILVWAMAGATVLGGFYAFFVHRESKVMAIIMPMPIFVWAMTGATVLGGFYILHREPKDKAQKDLGVTAIIFSSAVLVDLLVVPPPSMEGVNGAVLVLALATFLCSSALTLVATFSPGPPFLGSQRDAQGGNERAPAAYGQQPNVDVGTNASRIIGGITLVAAGWLIGAAPELSAAAPATTKTAAFFLLCTVVLGLFLSTVLSKTR